MSTPKVFVITCNDSVEHVWIGDKDDANQKMRELNREYFDRNFRGTEAYESYSRRIHWAVRDTRYTCGDGVSCQ